MWEQNLSYIILFSILLLLIILVMMFKDRLAKEKKILNILRYVIPALSFIYAGLILKAQPTTTNIIILINTLREMEFPIDLFLLEPFLFLSFAFILLTLFLWGRGVFCGWLCPYGALIELLHKLYQRIFPGYVLSLPQKIHSKLIYLKYVLFLIITAVSFYSFILSEYLTEVEPFRTFVLKLNREWHFVLYFFMLTLGSAVVYRAFCRYICPLGAALAIPSFVRMIPFVRLRRYDFCTRCKICNRTCSPDAISAEGVINTQECLFCLNCQVNYWDEEVCPVLIRKKEENNLSSIPLPQGEGARVSVAASLMIALLFLIIPSHLYAKTIVAGVDYPTIEEALKKAKDGDLIEVRKGEYKENLHIQKAVHLRGINNPVIAAPEGNIIEVSSPRVIIEGFTLRFENKEPGKEATAIYINKAGDETVIRNNHLSGVMFGIWNVESSDIRIEDNIIEGMKGLDMNGRGNCINLTGTQKVHIVGNKLNNCRDGIYMEISHDAEVTGNEIKNSRFAVHTMWVERGTFNRNAAYDNLVGLAIMYTRESEIRDNRSAGNKTHGLLLLQTVRSDISGNTVIGNTKGIFLYNSIYNKVVSNLIMNNNLGIHSWGGSEDNNINGNSFISNEIQVKYVASLNQEWEHNYWSDYLGWDMAGDNIGDLPYESNSVVDHLLWNYPASKMLFTSPALQLLWVLERQFPFLKVPRVVDNKPAMLPLHANWKEVRERYPYVPERYYGEMEKIPHHH